MLFKFTLAKFKHYDLICVIISTKNDQAKLQKFEPYNMTVGQRNNNFRRRKETKRQRQSKRNAYFQDKALKRILSDDKFYETDASLGSITYENRQSRDFSGYAAYYLRNIFTTILESGLKSKKIEIFESQNWDRDLLINLSDVAIYKKLLLLDHEKGTTETEQLFSCLQYSMSNVYTKK